MGIDTQARACSHQQWVLSMQHMQSFSRECTDKPVSAKRSLGIQWAMKRKCGFAATHLINPSLWAALGLVGTTGLHAAVAKNHLNCTIFVTSVRGLEKAESEPLHLWNSMRRSEPSWLMGGGGLGTFASARHLETKGHNDLSQEFPSFKFYKSFLYNHTTVIQMQLRWWWQGKQPWLLPLRVEVPK